MDSDDTSKDHSPETDSITSDLTWQDYIAILVALSRTVILPFILIAAVLFGLFLLSVYAL